MHPPSVNGNDPRLSFWLRVREFAVPPSTIEAATERRLAGDWRGACAAAGFDTDIDLRALARRCGREVARQVLEDLRHLAPDLLRWHLPRVAPDGLLRPALTATLARYGPPDSGPPDGAGTAVHLVARTAPTWADAGQRIVLTLWDGSDTAQLSHPHPRPNRRFRLDLHRHLWDARRWAELGTRCGTVRSTGSAVFGADLAAVVPDGCAVDRWAGEIDVLLRADGQQGSPVRVRCGRRSDLVVAPVADGGPTALRLVSDYPRSHLGSLPVLPDASVWVLPDLALLRSGMTTADRLHPLVAAALEASGTISRPARIMRAESHLQFVDCRGERHRIGLSAGVLTALDHDPAEVRREELFVALGGAPLPCLRAIDQAHRHPDCLPGVRERLDHGDTSGALALVEEILGPDAVLRDGPLLEELRASADRRDTYARFLTTPAEALSDSRPRRRRIRRR